MIVSYIWVQWPWASHLYSLFSHRSSFLKFSLRPLLCILLSQCQSQQGVLQACSPLICFYRGQDHYLCLHRLKVSEEGCPGTRQHIPSRAGRSRELTQSSIRWCLSLYPCVHLITWIIRLLRTQGWRSLPFCYKGLASRKRECLTPGRPLCTYLG